MAVLIIGATERERIAEIIAYAEAHPVPIEEVRRGAVDNAYVLTLKDREPDFVVTPSAHIVFPGGFRAAFSIEEQPAGLCSHLSINVISERKGVLPTLEAIGVICEEFGVPFPPDTIWNEEYEPSEYATNLLSLYTPKQRSST